MKFGLVPINLNVQNVNEMVSNAQFLESVGFESVWTFEHVIVPVDYQSKYPYNKSGNMGAAPETIFVDPLIALSAIAAATTTIKLGTGVNILSQTNPLLLAKQCASLDFVSNGRFLFGAGIGWLKEEFQAMGTPFEKRGERFDDYVVAMRKVWSGDVVEHQSDYLDWSGFKSYPIPQNKSKLPIIMGGNKGKIIERIAKYGDGWFIPVPDPSTLPAQLAQLKEACEAEGRTMDEIELTSFWAPAAGKDSLKALEDLGVERVVMMKGAIGSGSKDDINRFVEEYIAA